jgi:hypothetical protein
MVLEHARVLLGGVLDAAIGMVYQAGSRLAQGDGPLQRQQRQRCGQAAVERPSDSGNEVFNVSEIVGAGASAGLSSLYYPSRERSFANTGTEWGLDIGIDAASFMAKEFWPDIHHFLFRDTKPGNAAQH